MNESVHASPAQTAYADLLFYGCWVGLCIMLGTYLVYMTGLLSPHVPLEQLPDYWSRPVGYYLQSADAPTGWGWVRLLGRGDFLNFIGIALLASMSILCYIRTIPALFRDKDRVMGCIAVAEVVVLLLAASGIFGSGGH